LSVTVRAIRLACFLLLAVAAAAACGSTTSTISAGATATRAPSTPGVTASPPVDTAEPVATLPDETVGPPLEGQTETGWGRIWDTLPAGFPTYPGAVPSEEAATGPASAVFVVEGGDPADIATWYQGELEIAAFSTEGLSGPLEDGGYVIDSTGQDPPCRLSLTIAPLGGMTTLTVLYGAACPHD
jgi:hypothetical protein